MIRSAYLHIQWRRRVRLKTRLEFGPGLNTLVGPNGSGKSSIIKALLAGAEGRGHEGDEEAGDIEFDGSRERQLFDTELDNPRVARGPVGTPEAMALRIRGSFSSHGQMLRQALASLATTQGTTLFIDEPEAGQDFDTVRRIKGLIDAACTRGYQVIAASHHPVFWVDTHLVELEAGYVERVSAELGELLGGPPDGPVGASGSDTPAGRG
jgi:energy-coupling factor transporter ATP-binding protein EcfA2